jgi:hypothetical protein
MTLVIQCVDAPRLPPIKEESHATAPTPSIENQPAPKADETSSTLQKIYKDFKRITYRNINVKSTSYW